MAKNLIGLAEYEFWRWEYQRRNQGYRDAIDQLVALVSARAEIEGVYTGVTLADLLTSDKHAEHLRQLLKTPFVTSDCLTESPFIAFVTPEEFLKFIKMHKRIPDHYSWGFSGQELLAQDELGPIPGQFEPSSFHVPDFHVAFSFPEGGETRIDLSIPIGADIDVVQLELAYVHALGKVRGTARYVVPGEPNGHWVL